MLLEKNKGGLFYPHGDALTGTVVGADASARCHLSCFPDSGCKSHSSKLAHHRDTMQLDYAILVEKTAWNGTLQSNVANKYK